MSKLEDLEKRAKFQTRIEELISETEISKAELAKKIGITETTLIRIAKYGIIPQVRTLVLIANYFNISMDYLLGKIEYDNFIASTSDETFFDRLMLLKKNAKIKSDYQLANTLHITKQMISDWKYKSLYPNLETLETIADVFKVSLDYLLGRTD